MENFRFILSKLKKPSHHQVVKENDKAFTHREPRASRTSRWFGKYIAKSSFYVSYSTSRRINWIISISLICFILFSLWILKWGQYWNFFNSSNSLSKTKPTSHYQFIWWELLLKEKVENQSFNLELTANKLSSMIPEHSNCENTIQTKIYVTDSKGHSCLREELDNFQCCPKNSPQYSCNACKGDCCTQFENCVSCCLNPSKVIQKKKNNLCSNFFFLD